jgi:ABC-2 type transport system permease protein
MMAVFWHSLQREVLHVYRDRWDAGLLVWAPLAVLLLLGWMFMAGVPRQLPIAVIDDDHSTFSRLLIRQLERSPSLSVPHIDTQWSESLARLQRLEVWGIVHIPAGAEAHLRQGEGAQISHVYNEAFYSLGGSVAAGVRGVVTQTTRDSLLEKAHYRGLPVVDLHLPTVQVTPLFNPQTSYELFLEPLAVLAILHLILACAVVSAVGREVTTEGLGQWLGHAPTWTQLLGGAVGQSGSLSAYDDGLDRAVDGLAGGCSWLDYSGQCGVVIGRSSPAV